MVCRETGVYTRSILLKPEYLVMSHHYGALGFLISLAYGRLRLVTWRSPSFLIGCSTGLCVYLFHHMMKGLICANIFARAVWSSSQ